MKSQYLSISSFTVQATSPLYSSAYLTGYLKYHNKDIKQLDINSLVWNEILSYDYLKNINYNEQIVSKLSCPMFHVLTKEEFEELKKSVLENISYANLLIRSKDVYSFQNFLNAHKIYRDAFLLIYHQYGTFLTTHFPYWGNNIGFDCNKIDDLYNLATDERVNPLIAIFKNKVIPLIKSINPEMIFVEIMFPYDLVGALSLNILIKESIPNIHINYPGISFDEFNFSRMRDNLLKDQRFMCGFDSIFIYRNDNGILLLMEGVSNNKLNNIDNLIYKDGVNILCNNTNIKLPYNEDIIPDYSDLELSDYFIPENVFIERLSTKCFWSKCSFCSINSHKGNITLHDISKTINRVKLLQSQYNVNYFWFLDEACPITHAQKFAKELKANSMNITWSLRTRIDRNMTKAVLQELYDSGLRELLIGLEHVNTELIVKMNKISDAENYKEYASNILKDAAEIGIGLHFCHLLGFPSETNEQREEIIEFYIDHKDALAKTPFFGTINTYALAVDSPAYKDPEKYGISSIKIPEDGVVVMQVPYTTVWNDQTSNPHVLKAIESFSNRLIKQFTNNPELEYFWYVISDSPFELLFKANYESNPFLHN